MRRIIALPVLAVVLGLFAVMTGMTDGLMGPGKPMSLRLQDASHRSTPIMVEDLRINGVTQRYYPGLASSAWENPRGAGSILKSMDWPEGHSGTTVTVAADWVEVFSGRAYSASLELPWTDLTVEKIIDWQADITVVYGRNGAFMVSTDTGPDPVTGQYNGTVVAQTCGARHPARDRDYMAEVNAIAGLARLAERRTELEALEPVATACALDGGEA